MQQLHPLPTHSAVPPESSSGMAHIVSLFALFIY